MKKIISGLCLIAMCSMSSIAFAGTPLHKMIVPTSVKESFRHDYPGAHVDHWKMVDGKWQTSFWRSGDNSMVTACYDREGRHIDSRMPVRQSAVPDKVMNRLDRKYPGDYTHKFTRIDRPKKRELYAVRVRKQGEYKTLYLDKKGHEHDYASR